MQRTNTERKATVLDKLPTFEPQREFFNSKDAGVGVMTETPDHLRMIQLKFSGQSNVEIAAFTGFTPVHVGTVLRQPWAKKRLLEMFKESGDDIGALLEEEAKEAILVLGDIMRDQEQPASARVASAINLADRRYGKATQKVEVYDGGKAPSLKDMESLDSEIARAEAALKLLEGSR